MSSSRAYIIQVLLKVFLIPAGLSRPAQLNCLSTLCFQKLFCPQSVKEQLACVAVRVTTVMCVYTARGYACA